MSHTLELSRERKQLRFASREEALQDMARRAGEITGTFIDPKAFSHLVHGDRPEWVAEWTRTDLVNTVEIYRCADQDRIGLATAVAILGDGARTAAHTPEIHSAMPAPSHPGTDAGQETPRKEHIS